MWQSGIVALWQTEKRRILTDFHRLHYAEIWLHAENVVPLHCQKLSAAAATIKTKNC
jgi:hypothetical protein